MLSHQNTGILKQISDMLFPSKSTSASDARAKLPSMVDVSEMQLRLVYSLLKPVIRAAARFSIPVRSLNELLRLAYYEHLSRSDLSLDEIAQRFGQTTRHMRSLGQRLESDFFQAEREVGLVREVEALVAETNPTDDDVVSGLSNWPHKDVRAAILQLCAEERIERDKGGRLVTAKKYVVLRSDGFHHRIDSLNHFLDGGYRAVLHRLVFNNQATAIMKTLSFSAVGSQLREFLDRLEGNLRRELAELDENATFSGHAEERYTMSFGLAPVHEPVGPSEEIEDETDSDC